MGGAFGPGSAAAFVAIVNKGGKESSFVLQVYGYSDMVCTFVLQAHLSESLVYDACPEMSLPICQDSAALEGISREDEFARMDAQSGDGSPQIGTGAQTNCGHAKKWKENE